LKNKKTHSFLSCSRTQLFKWDIIETCWHCCHHVHKVVCTSVLRWQSYYKTESGTYYPTIASYSSSADIVVRSDYLDEMNTILHFLFTPFMHF